MYLVLALALNLTCSGCKDAPSSAGEPPNIIKGSGAVRTLIPHWGQALTWDDAAVVVNSDGERVHVPAVIKHSESGVTLVLVPAGDYRQGCDDPVAAPNGRMGIVPEEGPRRRVRMSKSFYIGMYEITNTEYRRAFPWHTSGDCDRERQPVSNVSRADALEYCARYGFRLPTESEWEYCCRAGTTGSVPWDNHDDGAQWANLYRIADAAYVGWGPEGACGGKDGSPRAADVGSYRPNGWGLHDMIGNVAEWCRDDWDGGPYPLGPDVVTDPVSHSGHVGIARGGSWGMPCMFGRSCARMPWDPAKPSGHIGFRVAMDIGDVTPSDYR